VKPALSVENNEAARTLYWTVPELAEMLKFNSSTIIRMFQDEPGVLKLNNNRMLRRARPHVTLRIPDAVLQRKLRDLGR
jgi:hypothetical protein